MEGASPLEGPDRDHDVVGIGPTVGYRPQQGCEELRVATVHEQDAHIVCAPQTAVEFERRPHARKASAQDQHAGARRPIRLCGFTPVPWLCGPAHYGTEVRADGTDGSGSVDGDALAHLLLLAQKACHVCPRRALIRWNCMQRATTVQRGVRLRETIPRCGRSMELPRSATNR